MQDFRQLYLSFLYLVAFLLILQQDAQNHPVSA